MLSLSRTPPRRSDWISRAWAVPSWLISLLFHTGAVALLIAWSHHWRPEPVGFTDERSREIGIVVKDTPGTSLEPVVDGTDNALDAAPPSESTIVSAPIAFPSSVPPTTPPSVNIPAVSTPLPTIGAGASSATSSDARELIKGSGGSMSTGPAAGIPGAAFLGARDQGTRVVFVVDCSASMASENRMRTAKAALVSSLQALTESQQFQIIFYNQTPSLMRLRNIASTELAYATEVNKTFARQHIAGIEPDLGTDHLPALKLALRLNPEVIFFLTDADEPVITPGELQDIQRLNQGRARIHTIEFGRDTPLGESVNFLQKLARQNGGTYRYHDVRRTAMER